MYNFDEPSGFGGFLREMPLFFKIFGGLVVTLAIGVFLYVIIKGLSTWTSNNAASLQTQNCKVVDKRTQVWGGSGDSSATTNYFITFEFADHSRVELPVNTNHFGIIVVGDQGELTYQGTRFKDFKRILIG